MRQKSVPEKEPATEVVKRSVARRGDTSRRKTRSALYWKACAAKTASPSSAAARGSPRTYGPGFSGPPAAPDAPQACDESIVKGIKPWSSPS